MELSRVLQKLLAPTVRRTRLMIRRAVVKLVYDDPKMQELQIAIMAGRTHDNVERWEDYGLTSHPHPGAEALVLALGGNSDHSAVIKVGDRRYRLTSLAEGEVALYDDQGQVIHLKRNKQIHIYGTDKLTADVAVETALTCPLVKVVASTKVILDTPLVEATKDVDIKGKLTVATTAVITGALSSATSVADPTGTMQTMRDSYNSHQHQENGDGGGTTNTPTQQM